jgi:hypothetical protein
MTSSTGDSSAITMIEREGMIKVNRFPGCGDMASRADRPIFSTVMVIRGMAGEAIFGRACKDIIDMTLGTGCADMRACQRESGQVVIKCRGLPSCGGVTSRTVCPILAAVAIIFSMAGIAQGGRSLELEIGMAFTARSSCVLTSQLEDGIGVIEITGFPAAGAMTG